MQILPQTECHLNNTRMDARGEWMCTCSTISYHHAWLNRKIGYFQCACTSTWTRIRHLNQQKQRDKHDTKTDTCTSVHTCPNKTLHVQLMSCWMVERAYHVTSLAHCGECEIFVFSHITTHLHTNTPSTLMMRFIQPFLLTSKKMKRTTKSEGEKNYTPTEKTQHIKTDRLKWKSWQHYK